MSSLSNLLFFACRQISPNIQPSENVELIDANGLYVIPGGVDPDCRLINPTNGLPVADGYKKGSIASLLGGTTTISKLDFSHSYSLVLFQALRCENVCEDLLAHQCLTSLHELNTIHALTKSVDS